MNHPTFQVTSMFSGCGGMDLGFVGGFRHLGKRYPKNPFTIQWANDLNRAACSSYESNIGGEIRHGSIWDHIDSMPEHSDVIVGGFPCQDISVNGKRAGVAGARSGLYRAMVEAIDRIRPKVFIAENVKGLLMSCNQESLGKVLSDFGGLGYSISYKLYQSADYGVPQTRERVFIVGTAPGIGPFCHPDPTHAKNKWISAADAIGDLIPLREDTEFSHIWSKAARSPEQGDRRLKAERPGYTIRAECHGNIQYHYSLNRRMSMREAARIQSFPDSFKFKGGLRETERQVGNAVPPVLAWHVARATATCLRASLLETTHLTAASPG